MPGKQPPPRVDTRRDYGASIRRTIKKIDRTVLAPEIATVAFFDMKGSTAMMKKGPHEAILAMLRHNSVCRLIIERNGGRIIKELGDGLMVRFDNTGNAVSCAAKVIKNVRKYGGGISTKVVVAYGTLWNGENSGGDSDVYGTPVHIVSRMAEVARRDTILVDENDRAAIAEWVDHEKYRIKLYQTKLRDYPGRRVYAIPVGNGSL